MHAAGAHAHAAEHGKSASRPGEGVVRKRKLSKQKRLALKKAQKRAEKDR